VSVTLEGVAFYLIGKEGLDYSKAFTLTSIRKQSLPRVTLVIDNVNRRGVEFNLLNCLLI